MNTVKLVIIASYTNLYLVSHLITSYLANNEGRCKYMGIQSCHYCQFCVFVKVSIILIEVASYISVSTNNLFSLSAVVFVGQN